MGAGAVGNNVGGVHVLSKPLIRVVEILEKHKKRLGKAGK